MRWLAFAVALCLVWPFPTSAAEDDRFADLAGVLISSEDLGSGYQQVDLATAEFETQSFAIVHYMFLDNSPVGPDGEGVTLVADAGLPTRNDLTNAFERFASEDVLSGDAGSLQAVDGPAVGQEQRWWHSELPRVTRIGDGEPQPAAPLILDAVAFHEGGYFGSVAMAGPSGATSQELVRSYAAIIIARMRGELARRDPARVIDCYSDPTDSACSRVPLPLATIQGAVSFDIKLPCEVPPELNPNPESRLEVFAGDEAENRAVDILYWPADQHGGLARTTLSLFEQWLPDEDPRYGLIGTHYQVGTVDVVIQGGESGSGTAASWNDSGVHVALADSFDAATTLQIIQSMILGCDE